MNNRAEWLYAELRKYGQESNSTLSDAEKDRAILATVAHVLDHDFGHIMGKDAWLEYQGRTSKHWRERVTAGIDNEDKMRGGL